MAQIIANNNGGGGSGGGGSGDMKKSVYDPNNKNADAFDYNNFENTPDLSGYQTKDNLVTNLDDADNEHYPSALAVKNAISSGGGGDVSGPSSSVDGDIVLFNGNTGKIIKDGNKKLSDFQEKLAAQTAYTSKGTSAKVAQITTNTLGQVTNVTEVDIDYPSQVDNTAYGNSWDGDTTYSPTKNAVYDKINSMDTAIGGNTTAISTINSKIPSAATSSNQLADKDYVNDSINSVTAYYITKNAQGDQFATYAELAAATVFYSGGEVRVPTRNDYTIVLDDETHNDEVTRYIYNNGWEYQYSINESPMTQAQLNALNSGITAAKVTGYDNDLNTKTFVMASSSDTATAQLAYNWYAAGKNPILSLGGRSYSLYSANSSLMVFCGGATNGNNSSYTTITESLINVELSAGTVTAVSSGTSSASLISPTINYGTPFTPTQDGHPATKKYVDDGLSGKQDELESGTNIKTVNGNSLLGSGNIQIQGGISMEPTSPTNITYKRIGSEAEYNALSSHVAGVEYNIY